METSTWGGKGPEGKDSPSRMGKSQDGAVGRKHFVPTAVAGVGERKGKPTIVLLI